MHLLKRYTQCLAITMLAVLLLSAGNCLAFDFIKPYTGPVKFKYTNWEEEDKSGPGNKNGLIDQQGEILHGIAKINTINADNTANTTLWVDGLAGEELTAEFGGYVAKSIYPYSNGSAIEFTDGWLKIYIHPAGLFDATYPGSGVTDGTLFLSFKAVGGIVSADGTITLRSTVDTLTSPFSGKGAGYLQLVGGSHAALFGGVGAKLFMNSTILSPDPSGSGWAVQSEDPIRGVTGCSGKIGDFVWNDLNHNGIQDAGEPGIPHARLTLLDAANRELHSTTTGANGDYLFSPLCAGTYKIVVDEATLPAGVLPTPSNVGTDTAVDSNGSPATVTLATNDTADVSIDFGYTTPCTGKIGDLVWHDKNRNGLQDAGEAGIAGVPVTLKDAAASTVIATTATDANGFYSFSGLCATTYTVEATTPTDYTPTNPLIGPDRAADSNGSPTTVVLASDSSADLTADFGFITPCTGTIGDLAWYDQNRNGIQDAGEPVIAGATITLSVAGSPIATTATGNDGKYSFPGLCAGTYSVDATTPTGYLPTSAGVGTDQAIDSNGSPAPVTLPTDTSSDLTIDFGFVSPCTGSIGDFVWHDKDRNGIQDATEPGMNGIKLNLLNAARSIIQTTTSATVAGMDGAYQFSGLCPGNYTIEVDSATLPAGYTPTIPAAPGSDMTNDSNVSPYSVSLAEGEKNATVDFGYVTPCTGAIGDLVWHDLNRNGIQDETNEGIDGVTVNLTYPDGTVKSTTTNNGGAYQFTGLCAGNYTVIVDSSTLPPGYTATGSGVAGSTPANDSNGSPAYVNLPDDATSNPTIDFGYLPPCAGAIGDFVWNDVNMNGIQDSGETGINGVTVLLRNPADNTTYTATTTNANGYYLFKGLCAGTYKVEVNESTLTPGFVATISNAPGSTLANDSNGSPTVLELPIDFSDETNDFGYYMATGKGCSLTWGYWKTHSEFGPAPYDDAWAQLPNGASTPFFLSGQTWYQMLRTEPRGNAYYILAHQYAAAYLNKLNGADVTVISSQLTDAEALFKLYEPSDKLSSSVRSTFIALAYTLDQYNNGNIGPGHCKDTNEHHGCKDTHHEHDKDGNCVIRPKKCEEYDHAHDKDGNCVVPHKESGSCNDKSHPHNREGKCIIKVHR